MAEWYIKRGEKIVGPAELLKLHQLVAAGRLLPTDELSQNATGPWTKASGTKLFSSSEWAPAADDFYKAVFDADDERIEPTTRQCPYCKETVLVGARKCKYCGELLDYDLEHYRTRRESMRSAATATPLIAGIHLQRIAIAFAAGVGMLATFLPWAHAPIIGSINGTAGDGWITLALFVPAIIIVLCGGRSNPVVGGARLWATIPAGIAAFIGLYDIMNFQHRVKEIPKDNPYAKAMSVSVQIDIGIFVLIAAGIALVVLAWAMATPPSNKSRRN
jgi:hypothetical protein